MKWYGTAAVAVVMFAAGWAGARLAAPVSGPAPVGDTVTVVDTVRDTVPRVVAATVTRWDTAWLPLATRDTVLRLDTLRLRDTVLVVYPREQREYAGEDWRAWVSGYRPALDSLHVVRRTERVTERPRRWHVGPVVGLGAGRDGFSPYIGVGLTYSLWSF